MTKRAINLLLALLLVLCASPAMAATQPGNPGEMPKPLYNGIAQTNVFIRTERSREADTVGHYNSGDKVQIIAYEPEWLIVVKGKDGDWVTGYVLRHTVSEITQTAEAELPYGATPTVYTAVLAKDATIRTGPAVTADPLFTLTEGAKIAILSIEDGWAKCIYWRQYGYFYMDAVTELTPVFPADTARPGDTIAAFNSFYNMSEEGLNPNRKINIAQACQYISIVLQPGTSFDFDGTAGPYQYPRGYLEGISYFEGQAVPSVGGGVCQVSSTLYNVLLALPSGMEVTYRRAHGPSGATYLPHGVDAAVGNDRLNLIFQNTFDFPVRIEAMAHDGALYIAMRKE